MTGPWIFGYGSIIWKPGFPFLRRELGFISGWSRRFWQASPDHRGTREQPGRVVTLMHDPGKRCWGVAYELSRETCADIFGGLDAREQAGYERKIMPVCLMQGQTEIPEASVYVANEENPCFLGPCSESELIEQIIKCRGPSGSNMDYVLRLALSLRDMGVEDPCVFSLERALLQRSQRSR